MKRIIACFLVAVFLMAGCSATPVAEPTQTATATSTEPAPTPTEVEAEVAEPDATEPVYEHRIETGSGSDATVAVIEDASGLSGVSSMALNGENVVEDLELFLAVSMFFEKLQIGSYSLIGTAGESAFMYMYVNGEIVSDALVELPEAYLSELDNIENERVVEILNELAEAM